MRIRLTDASTQSLSLSLSLQAKMRRARPQSRSVSWHVAGLFTNINNTQQHVEVNVEGKVVPMLSPLKTEFLLNNMSWARTSKETRYVSATKTNRLMLFMKTVAVYCENHTKHINTLCGQNAEF
jgi:hypothetical protein